MEDAEILLASSPTDAGISCWNLRSVEELLLHKLCSSPPHGLATGAGCFLASSQLRDSKRSSSGSTFHWSWNKPQVKVSSSLPIGPLVSHSEGTHIVGGCLSAISTFGCDKVLQWLLLERLKSEQQQSVQ